MGRLGFGPFQYKLMAISGAGWLTDTLWNIALADSLPYLEADFGLNGFLKGLLGSLIFVGGALGAVVWGGYSDTRGRRQTFFNTLLMSVLGGCIIAAAPHVVVLYAGLFVVGFASAGNLVVDGALFSELMPAERRGAMMVLLSVFWSAGGVVATALAWILLPRMDADGWLAGWRAVFLCCSAICAFFLLTRRGIPESPRWLLLKGRIDDCYDALAVVAKANGKTLPSNLKDDLRDEYESFAKRHEADAAVGLVDRIRQSEAVANLGRLFHRDLLATTILLTIIWALGNFAYTATNLSIVALLDHKGVASKHTYRDALIYNVAGIPGSLIGAYIVETFFGRKYTMALATLLTGVSMVGITLVTDTVQVICLMSAVNLFAMAMYASLYTYTPEVFPTAVRTSGNGLVAAASRVAAIAAPLVMNVMLESSYDVPLYLMASLMGACAISSAALPIETRGTKLK